MSQTIYKAVLVVVGNPVVLGFQDTLRARSGLVSDAAISKAEEAISKSNKETKAAWAKLSHKDSDEGSIRLLFETEGLGSAEVELIRVALEKGLDSSWRLQKLSKAMDHSVALFKCCDYDHDPKAMADKIPQFIKDNPFIAHVHTSATEKALEIFGRRYATGVAKSIQSIAMYMFDDGEFFFYEWYQP